MAPKTIPLSNRHDQRLLLGCLAALCFAAVSPAIKAASDIPKAVIVDNSERARVELIGSWSPLTTPEGYYGSDFICSTDTSSSSTARFTPELAVSGFYEVSVRFPASSTYADNAPFTVISATGNKTVKINERTNGGQWVSLGVYGFSKEARGGVLLAGGKDTTGAVVADAVRFAPVAAPKWNPEMLGDRVYFDWWAEDFAQLTDGTAISLWPSRTGDMKGTQPSPAQCPIKQNDQIVFENARFLSLPLQNKAQMYDRAIMLLFRVDLTGSGNGSIFSINSYGGGSDGQPAVSYDRDKNAVGVSWKSPGGINKVNFSNVSEDKSLWHCLVARRAYTPNGPVIYASLDGKQSDGLTSGESEMVMADWAMAQARTPASGQIGDLHPSSAEIGIDSIIILQGDTDLADAQRLMGWGMWRRGVEGNLPADHPYRNAPPIAVVPNTVFDQSTKTESNDLIANWWVDTSRSEAHKGEALDTSGWNMVFADEFDKNTVTNEIQGRGNWFAPVHGDPCGAAKAVIPPFNPRAPEIGLPGEPATYIQSDSSMTIRMQRNGNKWVSGAFCSANADGFGRAWLYPYVEVRMKTGPSSTGTSKGSWPGLWLKSINCFHNTSEAYLEYDIYEGYGSDPKGFHNSIHLWKPIHPYPGRIPGSRHKSNYLGLKTPGWYQNVDLFDGKYHTYGVMVTPDYVINMFDGREMFRFPTPIEMKHPLWFLADLALSANETATAKADGVYEMTIDSIKVYQNRNYPGYGVNYAR